ncbi:response regulator [Paracraurococcus lichenis]|uniref:Response regulator n=1 Tax=Paracraurococcus lichenis TaxID=3064888 RepID=A0ABT9E7R9_9PROT|nr:response regulator [Paracraurococcus sp. LOR1-02]MDO9712218.1 response regulator [Paracraurococcus sp. LOR1-02]
MDVLVVEDEPLVREVVADGLQDDGLCVVEAPTAEEALALFTNDGRPQVVVTDVNLGSGMDGLTLAEEAHRRWLDVGVVIMTGNPVNVLGRPSDPCERILLKPFMPTVLSQCVRELLGGSCRDAERHPAQQ